MVVLTGTGLNKRYQELNSKVNEAAKSKIHFEEVEDTSEQSDVDKLFKIDLASKYRNIDYILEVLKSGDSLYISRALKCDWITDDEYSHFVNPQNLEKNVFPYMSLKMKKKLLATLSMQIRNGQRAEEFHHYCMRNRMYKLGMSFLLYTNESFKIEVLTLHPHVYNDFNRSEEYVERFIGNSFLLAEYYLKVVSDSARSRVLYKLRYLYSLSQEQYLDLLETCKYTEEYYYQKTSLRLSRDIMKKHKKRVLKNPLIYLSTLNSDIVAKYSTSDDAKVYAVAFLPDESSKFWNRNYYTNYEYYLKLIPLGERFSFIKKIFTEKYPGEKFEENYYFFIYKFYEMMTVQEKEDWALRHVESKQELHGCGNDYIWYQFINFEKSFIELKKYILITPDNDKRTNILKTLVNSAKTQQELTELLEYYYNRHANELRELKREFLGELINAHDILNFTDECWTALEKIFYSLEVYHKLSQDNSDYQSDRYRTLSLLYYIIHEKPVQKVIHEFVISRTITVNSIRRSFEQYLDSKKLEIIFQYMISFFTKHVEALMHVRTKENIQQMDRLIDDVLGLISLFDKTLQDIPTSIYNYITNKDVFERFRFHQVLKSLNKSPPQFKMSDIMHYLKEDASLVVSKFLTIKQYFGQSYPKRNINWLIRKLSIYFNHDIAPEYVKLLNECLSVEELYLQTARVAVFGIFNLSSQEYKIDLLKKYLPVNSKIDHVGISRNLLTIQTAICSVACHSRPPLELSVLRDYIKGDYVQYCIPIFDSYLANLTPDQCLRFVESLLDSPVSIQKHALRLAFHCFSVENLKNLVLKVWKSTKNVSLRKVLYKALFDKVNYYHDNLPAQWELFEVLTIMTLDIHQDDDKVVFNLLVEKLPPNVFGQHLQSAYNVVSTFPKRTVNYERLTQIVETLTYNINIISKSILLALIEDHINIMLDQDLILHTDLMDGHNELINAKWNLVKTAIIKHKNMHFVYLVTDKCLNKWHKTHDDVYIYRRFYTEMLHDLQRLSYQEDAENYLEINGIFQTILADIKNAIPSMEIYVLVLQLKVDILTRQVLGEELPMIDEDNDDVEVVKASIKGTILKFSGQVKDLLKECIEEKKYFQSLHDDIQSLIRDAISKVTSDLAIFETWYYINSTDVDVLLCSVLITYDIREMHLFVMSFLPTDYTGKYSAEYEQVILKLKSLDDEEIRYFMWNKFYSSDYQYREFMPISL